MFEKVFKILFFSDKKFFVFIFISLFLSIFSYVFSGNLIESVNYSVQEHIKPVVWWDIVFGASEDFLSKEYFLEKYEDIEVSKQISFNATVFIDKQPKLFDVIVYDENYPLYWDFEYQTLNPDGDIVLNQANYELLKGTPIEILSSEYQVAWYYTQSPLSEISFFNEGRYLYIPSSKFEDTLVENLSRVDYSYFIKYTGNDSTLLETIINDPNLENIRTRTTSSRNQSLDSIIWRLGTFISVFNQTIFILTFFIIILSIESYYRKVLKNLWVLNILWCKRYKILFYNWIFFLLFLIINLLLVSITVYMLIKWFHSSYGDYFSFYPSTLIKWALVWFVIISVWVFSSFYKIFWTSSLELIKENTSLSIYKIFYYIQYLSLIFVWFLIINLISGNSLYSSIKTAFLFLVIFIILLWIIHWILFLIYKIQRFKNFYIRDAIRDTVRPGNISYLIVFSTLISFTGFIIFSSLSLSFLSFLNITKTVGNDSFVINVLSSDIPKIEKYFGDDLIYEIIPSRIQNINNKTLEQHFERERASGEFSREFFSTTNTLNENIIKWKRLQTWEVSIDEEFAKRINIKIWDEVTFLIAGIEKTLRVVNFREAQRNGTSPFFYFQFKPENFEWFPKTYFISYSSKNKEVGFDKKVFEDVWGHISFIKTGEILDIVISLSEKVIFFVYIVLSYIAIFTFLAFLVALLFLQSFKTHKKKVLLYLWSPQKKIQFNFNFEYAYLIILGFILSIIVSFVLLLLVFKNIDYFSLEWNSLGYWIGLCIIYLITIFSGFKIFWK